MNYTIKSADIKGISDWIYIYEGKNLRIRIHKADFETDELAKEYAQNLLNILNK